MNYETLKSALKYASETQGAHFIIKTNIALGRGINGVRYEKYHQHKEWESTSGKELFEYTSIWNVTASHLEIEVHRKDEDWNSGVFHYFIPLENIVEIAVKI